MERKQSIDSDDSEKGVIASYWASCCEMWHGFLLFLWDPQQKTVLGRNAKSWGRILIFYACYYSFLCALFAIAITIVLGTLDPYVPTFQTRIQAPGVSIQPRESSRRALNSDIKFTADDNSTYLRYVTLLDDFYENYRDQSNETFYQNCTNGKVLVNQKFNGTETAKVCVFNPWETLGPCAVRPYGYNTSQPCILVKANRIINWYPVGFNDLSKATGNDESHAPPLTEVLKTNGVQYDPYRMYVSCYGVHEDDQIHLNGVKGVSQNTRYFPTDNGIPFMYYPYYGNQRQPQYKTPVVAIQFMNVTRNVEIKVSCKFYARNIVDDLRMQIGFNSFSVKIDE